MKSHIAGSGQGSQAFLVNELLIRTWHLAVQDSGVFYCQLAFDRIPNHGQKLLVSSTFGKNDLNVSRTPT